MFRICPGTPPPMWSAAVGRCSLSHPRRGGTAGWGGEVPPSHCDTWYSGGLYSWAVAVSISPPTAASREGRLGHPAQAGHGPRTVLREGAPPGDNTAAAPTCHPHSLSCPSFQPVRPGWLSSCPQDSRPQDSTVPSTQPSGSLRKATDTQLSLTRLLLGKTVTTSKLWV